MAQDPNSYHRPEKPPVIPRHLTSSDLADISQVLEQVLQKTGLTPHPPIDLEGERKLGLKTLVQQARRAANLLLRAKFDGEHPLTGNRQASVLLQVVEAVEKEWRL